MQVTGFAVVVESKFIFLQVALSVVHAILSFKHSLKVNPLLALTTNFAPKSSVF